MPTLLVIEDEESLRDSIADMLEAEDYRVIQADNGLIGVQLASEHVPDLVICDIMMPMLDGYDVLQVLRSTAATADIPFIFLSAKAERSDLRLGMELGADDYLTKPFTRAELLSTVRTRLERQSDLRARQTEQLDDLRVTITSRLRHEFLTPLTVILNAAEILTRYAQQLNPAEISETAARVQKHGKALYRLIHKMLLYSQLEAIAGNPAKVQQARGNISYEAHLLTTTLARQIAQQEQRIDDLRLQVSELPPLQIASDHYRDLMTELLENAFKYSKTGTVVQVQSTLEADHCTLAIIDQGRGIDAAQLERVSAYNQFDRHQYEQQGAGLGLAIVKSLADIYAGQFDLSSQPGHGTLARVKFVSKV